MPVEIRADRPLRVVFCWAQASGYMAACWRALAARPDVRVHVLHTAQMFDVQKNRFQNELDGLSHEMFDSRAAGIEQWLIDAVARQEPDVVVVCGWIYWPYTRVMRAPKLATVQMVLGMDSPWRGTWSQRLGRFRLRSTLDRCAAVITAGERSATYARRLGVPEHRIRSGYYGFDAAAFGSVAAQRPAAAWPRQFLFVGRYVPQKDLGTLAAGYARYRQQVSNPWGLTCSGEGPERALLTGQPGIAEVGFTPPSRLPEVLRQHGAFVMPSHFEPWGVAIAEAASSGLPLLCSSACGATVDLVRPFYNGLVVAPRDPDGVARAMRWMHDHESDLPAMGARSHVLADGFSATAWATRWHNYLLEAVNAPRS